MFMAIRFFNNGFASISDENGEHDASAFVAEYYLRQAENKFVHCQYSHYENGDREYIFY